MARRRTKCVYAHPLVFGVVWDSGGVPYCRKGHAPIPTKTSRFWNQFSGSVPLIFYCKSLFHVFFVSVVKYLVVIGVLLFCLLCVIHLLFCSIFVNSLHHPSHLSTHTKCSIYILFQFCLNVVVARRALFFCSTSRSLHDA